MIFNDSFFREQLIALTRNPSLIEPRIWIANALASREDSRGVQLLKDLFERCLESGETLSALWLTLLLKKHAPLFSHQEYFQRIASAQSSEQSEAIPSLHQPAASQEPEEVSELITSLEGEDLISQSIAVAQDWSLIETLTQHTKVIPLISALEEGKINLLLNTLQLRSFMPGEPLIEEGEEADGVYWICGGNVEVTRRNQQAETIQLAVLSSGTLVGEMGLITRSPRVATVSSLTLTQGILLPLAAYPLLDDAQEQVNFALSHLVGRRMLENLTKFSPVFKAIPPEAHPELLSQFKAKVVPAGEVLLKQGQSGRGLYLILDGLVQVDQLGSIDSKWLREGDIFGEISLVYDSPVSATCTTARRSLLYTLKPDRFQSLVSRYPEIKHTLAELSLFRNLDGLYTLT